VSDAWMEEGDGPLWMPAFDLVEPHYEIPTHLLARIGYQECSWRPRVIDGTIRSSAGAVGIMQLMPQNFPSAGVDPAADIDTAGKFLRSLFARFNDWQEAVAAYNWGGGNEHHSFVLHGQYILDDMPAETQNYVRKVFADVPLPGALL
jgi:soluble lytic murein transglycosylase-like protein